ncbi:acyl-CoA dehydrogenase C-terminal domain-containing protein [Rugamonas apoptosis]|uniref:3-methylmercaptopropionyl-CoA dehydrogenase n=1 Tax=Rugamonas apoptosis TaxID=2758570 RepID=A0A7W2IJT2_9BURK|nr:acyl-CoA dehydrogenase C-terminal domain-containing protein [Rugamonas apoptosis]MBA5686672.1 acyl-CoA dehydrogenase C-terminal domain-containing protein [Rugamonas apoptosis]
MTTYQAPLRDTLYSLLDLHGYAAHYGALFPEAGLDGETVRAILEAMGQFAEGELAPLNASGDQAGARWAAGRVSAPPGFAAAYARFVADGWPALAQAQAHGGQGLPYSLHMAGAEFLQGANQAWCMYAMLNDGAIKTLLAGAAPEQLRMFLPKLVSGEWTATMCLTEAQAGSDLGLLSTRAVPQDDGSYRITGNKIFISSGEHDLAPNIVHLVLARLPGAPPGVRGISLFVVPRRHVLADGALGGENQVSCLSIEHKMGLKGSATCVMAFDGAQGWLVGEAHRGMASMFIFINKSRLGVATQAVAQAQAAHADALAYARQRQQGRAASGAAQPGACADALIEHADVRRMLLLQKAIVEGGRALVHHCARWVDLADGPGQEGRERAARQLGLLTPIAKACLSELACEAVDLGIQVLGGHGYMTEWGMEQRLRDVRVTRIYEGTTGIQAMDLLGRKVLADARPLQEFADEVRAWCAAWQDDAGMADLVTRLRAALRSWLDATAALAERAPDEPDLVGAVAVDYLMLAGYVVLGYMWARAAAVSGGRDGTDAMHAGKRQTARFYFDCVLPRITTHAWLIEHGAAAHGKIAAALI